MMSSATAHLYKLIRKKKHLTITLIVKNYVKLYSSLTMDSATMKQINCTMYRGFSIKVTIGFIFYN